MSVQSCETGVSASSQDNWSDVIRDLEKPLVDPQQVVRPYGALFEEKYLRRKRRCERGFILYQYMDLRPETAQCLCHVDFLSAGASSHCGQRHRDPKSLAPLASETNSS